MELQVEYFSKIFMVLLEPNVRIFPLYLGSAVIIAYLVYASLARKTGFFSWIFSPRIWLHKSSIVDVKLFFAGRVLSVLGLFNSVASTSGVGFLVLSLLSGPAENGAQPNAFLIGLCILLANDFGVYWVHRFHHETNVLWPFHSVHHSAEVMTPITVYRKHPIYDLISTVVRGAFYGILQGIVLAIFVGPVEPSTIIGVNVFYFAFNILGSNLRHSHVWLSYGRVLEHILISPAQHQIHHSRAVRHHNKNYGEVLAIWDWMFGTLYIPNKRERLVYGLADEHGNPIEQPHATLKDALVQPIKEAGKALRADVAAAQTKAEK